MMVMINNGGDGDDGDSNDVDVMMVIQW